MRSAPALLVRAKEKASQEVESRNSANWLCSFYFLAGFFSYFGSSFPIRSARARAAH